MSIQAPILNSVLSPAVQSNEKITLKVQYRLSRGISEAIAKQYAVNFLFKTVPLNTVLVVQTRIIKHQVGEYILLEISNEKFTPGESYKIQMQFIGGTEGYWSTPATFKVAAQPRIVIEHDNIVSSSNYRGIFQASILDNSESIQSSKFILKDYTGNIIEESEEIIHNSLNDGPVNEQSKHYNPSEYSTIIQTETYTFISELKHLLKYQVIWRVITNSGLEIETEPLEIIQIEELEPDYILVLEAVPDEDNGIIDGYLRYWDKDMKDYAECIDLIFGNYILLRSSSKDNYQTWQEMSRMTINSLHLDGVNNRYSRKFFQDFSVESNIAYRYALQQYTGEYSSKKIKSNTVVINYEHLYLFDEERQLNLKYNPKISTYKTNILETKQDTIGGKYPYIFRNGSVMYKEFSVNALLSYQADSLNLFGLSEKDIEARPYNPSLSNENIQSEKIYREEVVKWLNNGQPKYLKSSTEGLTKIYVMNVSLTPDDTLGRMLYTISFTGYEIGESDELVFNLPNINLTSSNETLIASPFDYSNGDFCFWYSDPLGEIKVKNLVLSEIDQLSKVVIYTPSSDYPLEIVVGQAGLKIDNLEFNCIEIYHPQLEQNYYMNNGSSEDYSAGVKTPWISYIIEETPELTDETPNNGISQVVDMSLSQEVIIATVDLDTIIHNYSETYNDFINENQEIKVHEVLQNIIDSDYHNGAHHAKYSTFIQLQFIPISTDWKAINSEGKLIEETSYIKMKESISDKDYQTVQIRHSLNLENLQLAELNIGSNIQVHCAFRGVYYNLKEE